MSSAASLTTGSAVLVVSGLVLLCACAAPKTRQDTFAEFSPVRGQVKEQIDADRKACQWKADRASFYDEFVQKTFRNIEPPSLRVHVDCMTGIGYLAFLTYGQTRDRFNANLQSCAPAAIKARKTPTDGDVSEFASCMLASGYFVAGFAFARAPGKPL